MKSILVALLTLSASIASAQSNRPECASDAICFSGQVSAGQEFRKAINTNLEFVLKSGWTITIVPKHSEGDCDEFAAVVNPPYHGHRDLDLDVSYGLTAEEEVSSSPRRFAFVTNCADYRTEWARLNLVLYPSNATERQILEAQAKLGTSPSGKGRLWITESKTSHTDDTVDYNLGKIEWMKFAVEIKLPHR